MTPWRPEGLYSSFHHLFILLSLFLIHMQINPDQLLTKYAFSLSFGRQKEHLNIYEAFSPGFMMRSCWMLRHYVNECVPAHTDTETRQRGKKHTQRFVGAHQTVPMKRKKRERGEEERFKICCQRNKLYSSTQKQEQSFIFAVWSCKCSCVSSRYKCEIKHD